MPKIDVPYTMTQRRLDKLQPHPNQTNIRTITDEAKSGLSHFIGKVGLLEEIIFNKRTGHILSGHQRWRVLQDSGKKTAPVKVVDVDEATENMIFINMNNPEICGEFTDKTKPYLQQLKVELGEDCYQEVGLEMLEVKLGDAVTEPEEGLTDPDDVPDTPKVAKTKLGDLYQLGDHRLLCGDATKKEDVEKLLDGAVPFMMVTDPPYGVEYDPKWRKEAGLTRNPNKLGRVENDNICDWWPAWRFFGGNVVYIWHDGKCSSEVQISIEKAGFDIVAQIIWGKDRFALSRGDYHWKHEPCWYAVRKGSKHYWCGLRDQHTLWEIPAREDSGWTHGTQKPIECMARPIRNHGKEGDSIYDPFLGSGTTMIACEQLKRRCFGMEIDPLYCDVIVERWEKFTGKTAKLIKRAKRR